MIMEKKYYLKIFSKFEFHRMTKIYSIVIEVLNVFDRLQKEYEIQMIFEGINVLFDMYLVHFVLNESKILF
jgi:hypothetical protein